MFALGVFIGLFLASVPSMFGLNTNDAFKTNANGIWVWLWPVIFASSFAPAAIMNVYGENVLKQTSHMEDDDKQTDPRNVNIWYYLFIQSLFQAITIVCFMWLDCIPNFGTSNSWDESMDNIKKDWQLFFGMNGASSDTTIRAIVFVACYTLTYIGTSQMLRFTEGATWAAVVAALVTPLGGMFWLFFELDEDTNWFGWHPDFSIGSAFIISGLIVMSPFIYLYDKEAAKVDKKRRVSLSFNVVQDMIEMSDEF